MNEVLSSQAARLIDTYYDTLMRIAFTYVKNMDDAEDVVQDVFLNFYTHSPDFESSEHEKAWLIRCTINRSKNHLRSAFFRHTAPMDENLSYLPPEENTVLAAVMRLPENYRSVIYLHYFEKYTLREIAGLIGKKPATVGTWLARARDQLKTALEGDF